MSYEDQMLDPFINDGDEETPEAETEVAKDDDNEIEEFTDSDL